MRFQSSLPLAFALLAAAPAAALTPRLVKDINTMPVSQGSHPESYRTVGGLAYFSADDAETGRELWRTAGTAAGTFQVADACPGECSGNPRLLAGSPNSFFFTASAQGPGLDLWVTGGLPASTFRLAGPLRFPTVSEGITSAWVAGQGLFYFAADDGVHGMELWRSDGTAAGTFLAADVRPGPEGSNPNDLTDFNGRLFLRADGGQGPALWRSDGTARGTQQVLDPVAGSASHLGPVLLHAVGRTLFFVAPVGKRGPQLWKSDGTAKGTAPLTHFRPTPGSLTFFDFSVLGSRLLFVAADRARGQELWASDGTAAGTRALTNLSRADGFFPAKPDVFKDLRLPRLPLGNRLLFRVDDGPHGVELWSTDGTPKGTRLLQDVCPGSCVGTRSQIAVAGSLAFFTGVDAAHGWEPWVTDGTAAGTRIVRDLVPGSSNSFPQGWNAGGGKAFFLAFDERGSTQLWRSNGTARGTVRLTGFTSPLFHFFPDSGAAFLGGSLLFTANDLGLNLEPWISDGTPQGTRILAEIDTHDIGGSFPGGFHAAAGKVYFVAYDGQDFGLWVSDGTAAGTALLVVPDSGIPLSSPEPYILSGAEAADRLIFSLGVFGGYADGYPRYSLWRSDGTSGGTVRLIPEDLPIAPLELVALGGRVFFAAYDPFHGEELWATDGTPAGTRRVLDLETGPGGSSPRDLTVSQGLLYFTAGTAETGRELWRTDGTPGGTALVNDVDPDGSSEPRSLTEFGGRLYFIAHTGDSGPGLWRTDGTAAGTLAVDLTPDSGAFVPSFMLPDGSRLFLWGFTRGPDGAPRADFGLWVTDGTAGGTVRIADASNEATAPLRRPIVFNGEVFFTSPRDFVLSKSDGTATGTVRLRDNEGREIRNPYSFRIFAGQLFFTTEGRGWLYRSDGTEAGTIKLLELLSPLQFPGSFELVPAGPRLFFQKWDRDTGSELWAVE